MSLAQSVTEGWYWKWDLVLNSPTSLTPVVPTAPDTLMLMYADMWDGLAATFDDSMGVTFTKVGTPGRIQDASYNNKYAIDINTTDDYFTFDTLTHSQKNYCIFTVARQQGTTSTGQVIDFRSGTNYRLILPGYNTSDATNGWYYGQSSGVNTFKAVGDSTSQARIRCYIFEGTSGNYYKSGGTMKIDSTMEITALDATLRLGQTASISLDIEICHIAIFSLPSDEVFTSNFVNSHAARLKSYYLIPWADITR